LLFGDGTFGDDIYGDEVQILIKYIMITGQKNLIFDGILSGKSHKTLVPNVPSPKVPTTNVVGMPLI
jgi:hypothetical protein